MALLPSSRKEDIMDFKEYIETIRHSVNAEIMKRMPLRQPYEHYKIARDYSERMGSYRRPGLLMLCGEMFGASKEELLLPAAAMQASEDWILIHDDVEDDSEMRRGKPTLHKMYGIELAINAGDAVHIVMWKLIKDYMVKAGIEAGGAFFDKFYDMMTYTVEGQFLETNFIYNVRDLSKGSEELYHRVINSKTCYYTVYGPMQLGAIVAGQGEGVMEAFMDIGKPAGTAFQIADDILDMTADEKSFGKKRYGDLYEGKITLMMLHAYAHAASGEKSQIDRIFKKNRADKTPEDISFLSGLIDKYKSLDYARSQAEMYGKKAKEAVEKYWPLLPDNKYKEILLSAIGELHVRKK